MARGYSAQCTVMLYTALSVSTRQSDHNTQSNQSVPESNYTRYRWKTKQTPVSVLDAGLNKEGDIKE